jgi:ketosteroid isomerase-like protein
MSSSKEQIVRDLMEAWGSHDVDAAITYVHPEIEFDWSRSMAPFRGVYRGHAGLRSYWTASWEAWGEFKPQIEEAIDCGPERLLTVNLVRARGESSGLEISARGAMLWTFRDGKIIGATLFQDKDEALEAIALESGARPGSG